MFLNTNTERHKYLLQRRINLTDKMKYHAYSYCELVSHIFIPHPNIAGINRFYVKEIAYGSANIHKMTIHMTRLVYT